MSLSYLPSSGAAFVPRPRGFGAQLLGLDPAVVRTSAADVIVVARQERDLLRPDLTVLAAEGRLLPDALASSAPADGDWVDLELPAPETVPAFAATLAAVRALAPEGPVGVLLSGPGRLAGELAGDGAGQDEEVLDACALAVCDAAKAVLQAGGEVVLEEDRAPSEDELELWAPLLKLLDHHRRPALVVLEAADAAGALARCDAVGAVASGAAAPRWGAPWPGGHGQAVFAPAVDADASPERVQELVRSAAGRT